ncbi:MAG: hypothetical protein B2I17_04515 [Thermoplasmatales archaeon B_DKE]|nr:MAG: hypothetical protein B2I17_04515 [Thermoplasmatales archaeon B_DKE]QRF75731.1 hypothetical protein Thermo_01237 [Thermoplasmatales archaeon]
MERNNLMAVGAFVVISILLVGGLEFYNINEKPAANPITLTRVDVTQSWLHYDSSNQTVYANMTTEEYFINFTITLSGTVPNGTLVVVPPSVHNSTANVTYSAFSGYNSNFNFVNGLYTKNLSFAINSSVYDNMTMGHEYSAFITVESGAYASNILSVKLMRS